jgi:hypothetical protein
MAQWQWATLELPPYSLHMSPHDFDLFLKKHELL